MKTFLQLNTIFLSMLMEAIPFVLLGVILSGVIQSFLKEHTIARFMPKNRILSSISGCGLGVLFPACECGIVPITRRLLNKGMPLNAGIAFMLTGPIINPIVLFSTFIAFGSDWTMVIIRAGMAFAVALSVSLLIAFLFPQLPFRTMENQAAASFETSAEGSLKTGNPPLGESLIQRIFNVFQHAIDDFFSIGKYLIFGAFIAACMQTFVPTSTLLHLGSNPLAASLIMMALAFTLSLCSEADAFIASSFRNTFSVGALSAFLVFGPMIDIKNSLMLFGTFRGKFVIVLIGLISLFTLLGSLIVGRWLA